MRIIGGHDYYDSALAYGADREVVFAREKERKIATKEFPIPAEASFHIYRLKPDGNAKAVDWWNSIASMRSDVTCYKVTAIVTDTIYRGVEIQYEYGHSKSVFCWTEVAMETILGRYGCTLYLRNAHGRWNSATRHLSRQGARDEEMLAYYWDRPKVKPEQLNYLVENRISIALYRASLWDNRQTPSWGINGFDLGAVEFYRVMDPHTLYQELSMWVGGILPRSGAEMVTIDDKTRAAKHGFDRWSFRKMPEKAR